MSRSGMPIDLTLSFLRAIARPSLAWPDGMAMAALGQAREADWHAFVAFASAHFVLPAMAEPLAFAAKSGNAVPTDLLAFVEGIRTANRLRNETLSEALIDTTMQLNAIGVSPVALKGAAFLADPPGSLADWRFMNDIDLLVPADRLADCVAALREIGFCADATDYDPAIQAHYPPLISPCHTFSVELHTRLFGLSDFGIDVDALRGGACDVQLGAARLSIPSPPYRVAHSLAHAQLHNRNYVAKRLVLKDVLDLTMLPLEAVLAIERGHPSSFFADPRHRAAGLALLAAWRRCLGIEGDAPACAAAATRWAQTSIARLSWPRWRSLVNLPRDMALIEADRLLREPDHLGRRTGQILAPRALLSAGRSWTFKQRQRLWS